MRVVVDMYDPIDAELAHLDPSPVVRTEQRHVRALVEAHLRCADVLICGSRRQLAALCSREKEKPVIAIPFGLDEPPPPSSQRIIRKTFASITDSDKIVLWWGSVWRWLDGRSAVDAMAALSCERPDVKLVFAVGRPPPARGQQGLLREGIDFIEPVKAHADATGILGVNVFFLERPIEYESRHELLLEADVGLTLHAPGREAELAVRARYMDYLWAGLPCVLTTGNEFASSLAQVGLARLAEPGAVESIAENIVELLDCSAGRHSNQDRTKALAERHRWPNVVGPLERLLAEPGRPPGRDSLAAATQAARFYAGRARQLSAMLGRTGTR